MSIDRWIKNFHEDELPFAQVILENMIFISSSQTRALFYDAISSLSRVVCSQGSGNLSGIWDAFLRQVIIVKVSDIERSDAESGYAYARMARRNLKFRDDQIKDPVDAVQIIESGTTSVIFVDDMTCSGHQFRDFWKHKWYNGISFQDACSKTNSNAYFVPIIACTKAIDCLKTDCPGVFVSPVYTLDEAYSAMNPDSVIWQGKFERHKIQEFVNQCSRRAGLTSGFWGYEQLALCIAMEDGIPDASLPILSASTDSWKPLMERA